MFRGRYGTIIVTDEEWELELVHNDGGIPSRYQWFLEKDGEEERPVMTNSDMALARDFEDYMTKDAKGNEGLVQCHYETHADAAKKADHRRSLRSDPRILQKKAVPSCPVASHTVEKMIEYKMNNELFLYDFEKVLAKMLKNGY